MINVEEDSVGIFQTVSQVLISNNASLITMQKGDYHGMILDPQWRYDWNMEKWSLNLMESIWERGKENEYCITHCHSLVRSLQIRITDNFDVTDSLALMKFHGCAAILKLSKTTEFLKIKNSDWLSEVLQAILRQ